MHTTLIRKHQFKLLAVLSVLSIVFVLYGPYVPSSEAGFQIAMVRIDRMKASTATSGRVCAKPSVANLASSEAFVEVDFPSGFTVNTTASNWTVNTSNLDTGQVAWPGIATATNVATNTVRFPSTDLSSSSTLYCFNFSGTSTLTNATAGNSYTGTVTTRLTGPGSNIDQTSFALSTIADDQVVVTAAVGATFTFALSGNTDTFTGNLDPSTVKSTTSARTITVTTNAQNGWIVWAQGTNQSSGSANKGALKSATASNYTIPTTNANTLGAASHTMSAGTEDYGLATTVNTDASGGGTVALDTAYDGSSTKVGVLDTSQYRPIASANGTSNGDILNIIERATISNLTPPATDYTDTITFVGAGQF